MDVHDKHTRLFNMSHIKQASLIINYKPQRFENIQQLIIFEIQLI